MEVLITGSTGFLGRRAAAHFARLGHTVLTPTHAQLDITDAASVENWFALHRPQAVIHCAAVSDTGRCQQDPETTALVNVSGTANLAAVCGRTGAKFLFCSSDQVYADSSLPGPHAEEEPLCPQNVYANQKRLAEQLYQKLCLNSVILRLTWMYSTNTYPGEHGHLLTSLLTAIRDPQVPLTWPIHDCRGITDADTVAEKLPEALLLPPGIYNFGSENTMDTYHTVRSVLERLELSSALERLTPNEIAFAEAPRDIRIQASRAASFGIHFDSTQEGLYQALSKCL